MGRYINDLGDALFVILIVESHDVSIKEQMADVPCYLDKKGCVIEHFLGIVYVNETTTISLKVAIEVLFSKHGLSKMRLCGKGYDGAVICRVGLMALKHS